MGGGGLGITSPRGTFNKYTNPGFTIYGFGRLDLPGMRMGGLRLNVQGVFFDRDETDARWSRYPGWDLTEVYTNEMIKGTLGVEFSRRVISMEPYFGGGIGVYNFSAKTRLENEYGEELYTETLSSETYFGWNISGGVRAYVIRQVAIDINIQYDIVEDLKQYSEERTVAFESEFLSVFLGATVRFGF